MTASAFSVSGTPLLLANPSTPWTPTVDLNEKIWRYWNSATLPDGLVSSWTETAGGLSATQANSLNQPTMSAAAGGVVFSGGTKNLSFPTEARLTRRHRSFAMAFKANISGATSSSGTFYSANGFTGSTDQRAPYIGYNRASPNTMSSRWGQSSTLSPTAGDDTNWNFILSRRVNGVHKVSVNGGTELTVGTNVLIQRNITNATGIIGDFQAITIPWTCGFIMLLQNELSDAERDSFQGWWAWAYGRQGILPGGHPYFGAAPISNPWVNTNPYITDADFIAVQDTWWKNASTSTHLELNYGNAITSLIGSLPLVFSEDFTSAGALVDEAQPVGSSFYVPVQDAVLGWATQRSLSQSPTTYVQSGSEYAITLQSSAGVVYSGVFCSVNLDGRGNTWDPTTGPLYVEWKMRLSPGKGSWSGCWLKDVYEFQNSTTPRIEVDVAEAYGGDPQANHESLHFWGGDRAYGGRYFSHNYNSNYTGFKTGTPWPNGVTSVYDNAYHTYGVYIDSTYLIYTFDGLETCRCPWQRNMFQPFYILVSLQFNINDTPFVGPNTEGIDYVKVWQGTY